jgi:hypothetical protein
MVIYKSSFFAIFFIAVQAINTPAIACFDDEKLNHSIFSQQNSLFYVWSPRMALSATQAHLAADAAKAAGLKFVPLVDGRLPATEWQSALRTLATSQPLDAEALAETESLCSPKLVEKDVYAHFPTSFVVSKGDMHTNRLVGAMPAQFWAKGIQERLKPQNISTNTDKTYDSSSSVSNVSSAASLASVVGATADVQASSQCIPQNQLIALDPALAGVNDDNQVALGAYERISPDGRYVLRSFSGKNLSAVSLVELPGPPGLTSLAGQVSRQKIYSTPFSNEAFPVQGSWRYLVDTNGDHYTFSSILVNKYAGYSLKTSFIGNQNKPLFSGGMTGFYAAASEVGGSYPARDTHPVVIRSLSWPNANAPGSATENRQGEGMLTSRTITVDAATDPQKQRVIADTSRVNLCLNRLAQDGTMYALPMISVDGQEFAALPQNPVAGVATMRIFGFGADGKQCEPSGQFKLQSGKVIFGFSRKTKKYADVAYEYRGQVWWVQRDNSSQPLPALNLAPYEDPAASAKASKTTPAYKDVTASAFPGFSRDGRVIYAATWKRCDSQLERDCIQEGGYVVSDPYQSNAYRNQLLQSKTTAFKSCITVQDVAAERSAFAAFHGISN